MKWENYTYTSRYGGLNGREAPSGRLWVSLRSECWFVHSENGHLKFSSSCIKVEKKQVQLICIIYFL